MGQSRRDRTSSHAAARAPAAYVRQRSPATPAPASPSLADAGDVAVGARRGRAEPCRCSPRGGLWPRSTWLGRNWSRLPAAAARARRGRDDDRRRPRPEVTPRGARPARRARRAARPSSASPRSARAHPGSVPRDRAPRPQRAEPQRRATRTASRCSARAASRARSAPRRRARRHHRRGAALLPRAGRPAQPAAGAGAAAPRPAAGELDAARLRHRARATRRACSRG